MSVEFWSLDGGVLTVDGAGAEHWPVASSSMAIQGWMGRAVLSSSALNWLRVQTERYEGMRVAETYQHVSGPMKVMSGPLYGQRDFACHGEQRTVLWEAGDVGLMLQAEGRSRRWFLECAQTIRFEANTHSIRARPARRTDWQFHRLPTAGTRLQVTIPETGAASVVDAGRSKKAIKSDRSRRMRAGVLHSFDDRRQGLLLFETETVRLDITLLEASVETAAERLAELDVLEWRS